jgi:hypothetical protein
MQILIMQENIYCTLADSVMFMELNSFDIVLEGWSGGG